MSDRPLLVTSALPYANGPLHLGHLAGAYLPADLFVRYQRLAGRDVVYVCGSDEHGAAIAIRARQEGTTPQAIVDRYHAELEAAFQAFGISFDVYSRTSKPLHHETSQDLFRSIEAAGGFVQKTSTQLYDPEAGLFLADRFVKGTCPICGYDSAYGDQCENCGSSLSPDDLIEPSSTLSGATPERRETTHWYLPLGDLQPDLEAWIGTKDNWKPNVTGQIGSWFQSGLSDRAMTRDLDWGIPVPPDLEGDTDGKVLYVWFDAPLGYISATKDWAIQQGDPDKWRRYWQVQDGTEPELVHFIGKDNIVFHCLIFPATLMAANRAQPDLPQFVLPENVPANEFLNLEGRKLSTSRGWAVWADEAAAAFDPDLLRYALAVGLPETKDADFTWSDFQNRVNGELADVVGNFCNRALTFATRFCDGKVPALEDASDKDTALLAAIAATPADVGTAYREYRMRDAVARTVQLARLGNQYLQETEPWKTRKTDERAMHNSVHVALQATASLSILLEPIVPGIAANLRQMLALEAVRSSSRAGTEGLGWDDAARPLLEAGHALGEPGILVAKVEDEAVEAERERLSSRAATADAAAGVEDEPADLEADYPPLADEITFDQFAPLDLRVGRIVKADLHPKADKLLRFDVDLGFETRQILSGVREHFAPDDLEGEKVVVVANLKPRTIRGLESNGMILFAEDREGRLILVKTDAEVGAIVK